MHNYNLKTGDVLLFKMKEDLLVDFFQVLLNILQKVIFPMLPWF